MCSGLSCNIEANTQIPNILAPNAAFDYPKSILLKGNYFSWNGHTSIMDVSILF